MTVFLCDYAPTTGDEVKSTLHRVTRTVMKNIGLMALGKFSIGLWV
jgi:hypothetical protein